MQKVCISENWYFHYIRSGNHEPQKLINLPHDMVVSLPRDPNAADGASNGFWPGACGEYVHYFTPAPCAATILDVDGAYMCAEVIVNGENLGVHPHGYAPYLTDISDALRPGRVNKLKILVSALQPSSRWYAGGGLYRDVFLWTGGSVRIEPWDLFVTTPVVSAEKAEVLVKGEITADLDARTTVSLTVKDANGSACASGTATVTALEGEKVPFTCSISLPTPALWDPEHPKLYTLEAKVYGGGALTDTAEVTFGVRTMTYDAEHGFRLNGKEVLMRGGCIHHDNGVLGVACYPAAVERKLRILKAAGYNAIRTSHNPPSLVFLELCDRMGFLVMDEAFDMWRQEKMPLDYHLWFEDWWDTDIACMVKRDRNHPCVASYSIGNEIVERDGSSDGAWWSSQLAQKVREFDSTRPVTSAICGMWNSFDPSDPEEYRLDTNGGTLENPSNGSLDSDWDERTEDYAASLDIVGMNYIYFRSAHDHEKYPNRVMWGSETHALNIYDSWKTVEEHPWYIGDFTWTAYDNLGEAGTGRWMWARDGYLPGICTGPWPWRSCYQGDMDLCGYRRPQSYYRETVWHRSTAPAMFTTHPEHYGEGFSGTGWHWHDVQPTWTFDDVYIGKPVKVEVYTEGDEAEFFLNGSSLGRVKQEKDFIYMDVPYAPGTLTAVVYKDGKPLGTASLETCSASCGITLTAEKDMLAADGRDLCYLPVTVVDDRGRRIVESKAELTAAVEGGTLMGIFSGDPCNEDVYGSDKCHAFEGRALVVVSATEPGSVKVTVSAEGLGSAQCTVTAK